MYTEGVWFLAQFRGIDSFPLARNLNGTLQPGLTMIFFIEAEIIK